MRSIELEFDYLPVDGDAHARSAFGIVLELALCAAQHNAAASSLNELQFGPALSLEAARRCRATVTEDGTRVQVTSEALDPRAPELSTAAARSGAPPAAAHLRARLALPAPARAAPHIELGAFREALAAPVVLGPSRHRAPSWLRALRWHEHGACVELDAAPLDCASYTLHPWIASEACELALALWSRGRAPGPYAPQRARQLQVLEPGARIVRVQVRSSAAGSGGALVIVAESEHGPAWYLDGLELASAGAGAEQATPARAPADPRLAARAPDVGGLARTLLALSPPQRRARCERELSERVARLLGVPIEGVSPRAAFKDMGLSSLAATQLAADLSLELDRAIAPTIVFDYPTIASLVDALLRLVAGTSRSDSPAPPSARAGHEDIAILAMACRAPGGADTPDQLWALLCAGADAVRPVPAERAALVPAMAQHALPAGFLRDVELFDAGFFGMSERETSATDPQHRLLLETTWEALERAGIVPSSLIGSRTGVFVCAAPHGYGRLVAELDAFTALGNEPSAAAGRLSYFFGLRGPSLCVDTACSSSLVAICMACDSLRRGEIDLAIVGGVNLLLEPMVTESLLAAGVLSTTARRCCSFDADADGYARGEACGVLILRRGGDALRAAEPVQAVIRGYSVAHSGRANGLGAPSRDAQLDVIDRALADAGVAARDVGYVEAHGSATVLGDAVELAAIRDRYGAASGREQPVVVGSIKANIGHSELASGVVSTIKAVLLAQRGELPPQPHFARPTEAIDWPSARMAVARERQPWPQALPRRIVAVNALGMSGTYAHLLLEAPDAPAAAGGAATAVPADRDGVDAPYLVAVHGCSEAALRAQAGAYAEYLRDGGCPASLATTSQRHRQRFAHRAVVIGGDALALRSALQALASGEAPHAAALAGAASGAARPRLAFLYSGYGTHYAGMGAALIGRCPVFRAAIDECDRALGARLPCSLLEVMSDTPDAARWLLRAAVSQPAIFAVQHALTQLWRSWGVSADVVLGHSLGEIAAAHAAGVLSLEDAAWLAAERGRLMDELPAGGAMAAVEAPRDEVERVIAEHPGALWLAAANSPSQLVISGTIDAVHSACAQLERTGVRTRRLPIPFAAHSGLIAPILGAFERSARSVRYHAPALPMVSSMSGAFFSAEMGSLRYFREQLRVPVEFARGMQTLLADGVELFLELGPHSALSGPAAACADGQDTLFVASMVRDRDPLRQMLDAALELYSAGLDLHWEAMPCARGTHDPRVPVYAFQRRRYWLRKQAGPLHLRDGGAVAHEEAPARSEHQPERLLRFPDSEAVARLERLLRAELRRILDPEPLDADFEHSLAELGLGSLGAVQLRSCLQRWVGVPLPLSLVSGGKTVRELANDAWAHRNRAA